VLGPHNRAGARVANFDFGPLISQPSVPQIYRWCSILAQAAYNCSLNYPPPISETSAHMIATDAASASRAVIHSGGLMVLPRCLSKATSPAFRQAVTIFLIVS
jgi:hypothetical protein